jgi:hypothetical protein
VVFGGIVMNLPQTWTIIIYVGFVKVITEDSMLKEFNIKLRENEVKLLSDVLGELPTKYGVYNILARILGQANAQLEEMKKADEQQEQSNTEPV